MATKDTPAPTADDKPVVDETTTQEDKQEAPELSQAEVDALDAATGGVEGKLTANSPVEENKNEETPPATEETSNAESEPDKDKSEPEPEEDNTKVSDEESTPAEPAPELKEEKDETGVYAPTAENPGDFKPGDYSFEIKTTDGKTVKIASPENIDEFASKLDENPELVNASQYTLFNRKSVAMDVGLASDKQKYDAQKEQYDQQQTQVKIRDDTIIQWNNEINYLEANGDLPEISDEMNKADWTNPEVAKDPAVKARLEIFKWMETENKNRLAAGLEPVKSAIDAQRAMQLEAMKKDSQATVSREKATRQKKGAMVGGNSTFTPSNTPTGTIIGEGGSIDDLVTDFYNQ